MKAKKRDKYERREERGKRNKGGSFLRRWVGDFWGGFLVLTVSWILKDC